MQDCSAKSPPSQTSGLCTTPSPQTAWLDFPDFLSQLEKTIAPQQSKKKNSDFITAPQKMEYRQKVSCKMYTTKNSLGERITSCPFRKQSPFNGNDRDRRRATGAIKVLNSNFSVSAICRLDYARPDWMHHP